MKKSYFRGISGMIVFIFIWQFSVVFTAKNLPMAAQFAPLPTVENLWQLLQTGEIFPHIGASLQRVIIGLTAALVVGVPIGLALGFSPRLAQYCTPAFQFLRMISPLSWMPIVVIVFGVGDLPIYFLLGFAAVWSLIIATSAGVQSIDPQWLQLARVMLASKSEILRKIVAPAIAAHILTGLRVALGIVWVVLVPCEMLGVNEGLGYFILDTRDRLAYSELMAVVVIIGLLGWGLDSLLRVLLGKRT
ncbi:ABC transporter permease [Bibersteinia trehalosi]|uniref:ABC transporter permease n=1 Tax=Bibersteinia trehalosi TaxID=47735 RepID=UPI0040464E0E